MRVRIEAATAHRFLRAVPAAQTVELRLIVAEWARQAMEIIIYTRRKPSLMYPFNLFPLRVLKRVVCMFFSVNSPLFHSQWSDLVRFVLNRELRDFPPKITGYVQRSTQA
jgi:hypothetical protein